MNFINALVNLVKSNLFQRLVSACFLLAVLIFNIICLQNGTNLWFFYTTIYAVIAISFWELNNIFFNKHIIKSLILTAINLLCFCFIAELPIFFPLLIGSLIVFNLLSTPRLNIKKTIVYLLYLAILLVSFNFIFFYLIKLPSVYILTFMVYIFAISIMTDTFGYIVGKLIGKHKLAPSISPGKTIEGALGALVLTGLCSWLIYTLLPFKLSFNYFIGIAIAGCIIAQIGDLFESYVKRVGGVKDSSHLIPGHGGVLDRLDSFIFLIFVVQILFWI